MKRYAVEVSVIVKSRHVFSVPAKSKAEAKRKILGDLNEAGYVYEKTTDDVDSQDFTIKVGKEIEQESWMDNNEIYG